MSDVTQILNAIEQRDLKGPKQLVPLVCDGLRKLAAQKLAQENPGQIPARLLESSEALPPPVSSAFAFSR